MSNFIVFVFIHTQNLFYNGDVDLHFPGLQKSLPGCFPSHPHLSSPAVPLPDDQIPKMKRIFQRHLLYTNDLLNNG